MTHTLLFIALAVAQNTSSNPAPPPTFAGHGNNVQNFIEAHDLNKDGVLTREEFETFRRQRFDASDFNRDGHIDLLEYIREFDERIDARLKPELETINAATERRFKSLAQDQSHISRARYDESGNRAFAAYSEGKLPDALPAGTPRSVLDLPTNHTKGGMLALYDRNSDGTLTREEYDEAREEQFKRTDANGDGKLSRHEYEAEFNQRIHARINELKTRSLRQTAVRFGALDKDKNDQISWDEYMASGMSTFQRADRNSDGKVDSVDASLPAPARNSN